MIPEPIFIVARSSIGSLPSCCYDKKVENFSFATELSPEDFGWEYQNYYTLPSLIRRQLAKRTYELPSEMAGFGSGSAGYLAGRSDSKAPKMSALWKTRVG